MNLFWQTFSLVCLASVTTQICIEETLDCSNPVSTIFKLGSKTPYCACDDPGHTGTLKYFSDKVHVCSGNGWKVMQFEETQTYAYGTENNPGYSCKDILDKSGQQLNDGVFWIRLRGRRMFTSA